jgi:hypothetical protein
MTPLGPDQVNGFLLFFLLSISLPLFEGTYNGFEYPSQSRDLLYSQFPTVYTAGRPTRRLFLDGTKCALFPILQCGFGAMTKIHSLNDRGVGTNAGTKVTSHVPGDRLVM